MNDEGARRLELFAPLVYIPAPDLLPFLPGGTGEEPPGPGLFCFALDETQSRRIEPEGALLLGPLIAAGYPAPGTEPPGPDKARVEGAAGERADNGEDRLELPRGSYLFAQEPGALGRDEVLAMAVDVQKDGLWERLRLDGRLYLRYVYGDRGIVTQVFRPYRD